MKLTLLRACDLFTLNHDGTLLWRVARKGGVKAGDAVGCDNGRGYLRTSVDGVQILVHVIVWLMTRGAWPDHEIDHDDRNKRNNRPDNLLKATRSSNVRNRLLVNKTGFTGVQPNGQGFCARITDEKRVIYLGQFAEAEQAGIAYREAFDALKSRAK